ncbi:hypothetical protein [Variovorax sp. V15]|uniref:hypothetical protein n=1 Tax=Variovorax sp. V15 TaxID=3065952 RepID=UPI0034E86F08
MSKVNLISLADYALHRGCSKAAVTKAAQAGRITLIDGKIDPMIADAQWKANTRARIPARAARDEPGLPAARAARDEPGLPAAEAGAAGPAAGGASGGGDDYWDSRGRREAAEAELAELKVAEQRRELIRVSAVELVWAASLAAAREHLLQVRARLGPLLAAETDVFKIEQLLDEEHSKALQLLAGAEVRKAEGDA